MVATGKYYCVKCGKNMEGKMFYTHRDGTKTEMCKACLTMHIDNYDENTFLWILKDMDVPYIEEEWIKIRNRAVTKNPNLTGMSVIGKYLSSMKLSQHKNDRWADTEKIREKREKEKALVAERAEVRKKELAEQYENGEISEAEYKTLTSIEIPEVTAIPAPVPVEPAAPQQSTAKKSAKNEPKDLIGEDNPFREENFFPEEEMPDVGAELTHDDKLKLALKWGRTYRPNEWIEMEQKYNEMCDSFDVQDSDTETTLRFLCKTALKMNQAVDCGDIDTFNKLQRTYDALRKSAKFTASQKKEEAQKQFDSVGQIVRFAETVKGGGKITRHKVEYPIDVIDESLLKINNYTQNLINNEPNISDKIANYIKKREIAESQAEDERKAKAAGLDAYELTDEDYIESSRRFEEMAEQDAAYLKSLSEGKK